MFDPSYESTKTRGRARRTRPPLSFEKLDAYRAQLSAIVVAIDRWAAAHDGSMSWKVLRGILRQHPREGRGFFSSAQILAAYRAFSGDLDLKLSESEFIARLPMRPTRTLSGVTPVTVFTRPHPCPGQCVFCPNDVRMPKSYLSDEPAAQRAEDNGFDPYAQTMVRLKAFWSMGHPTSKVEIIILGGTWSFYPEAYQRWFVKRCFDALNAFAKEYGSERVPSPGESKLEINTHLDFAHMPRHVDGAHLETTYNQHLQRDLRARFDGNLSATFETASWQALEESHRRNERAECRCVGLVMETRPDRIDDKELLNLRRLGATKVQIGIQSTNDSVLALNKRGHTVAAVRETIAKLRGAGFKVHAHWMANLLGGDPEQDKEDFLNLFNDPGLRPDELKVYPCSLVESAELMQHFRDGSWRPYSEDTVRDILVFALEHSARYCRLTRVMRDIPATDIVAGNRKGNLREAAETALVEAGKTSKNIRFREVRAHRGQARAIGQSKLTLKETAYETSNGVEIFIEWVDDMDRIYGFLRLVLPNRRAPFDELRDGEAGSRAIIREVHVYGRSVPVNSKGDDSQHRGLGSAMVTRARSLAAEHGFSHIAVISAVGTRDYYRKLGFVDGTLYQHASTESRSPVVDATC